MYGRYWSISTRMILTLLLIVRQTSRSCRIDQLVVYATQYTLCPNGRKKSHCMLVRRAAWSQLCLGVKIGRNVHTARFNGRKCSYTSRSSQSPPCRPWYTIYYSIYQSSTRSRKTWARIPAQSEASFFPQRFQIL